MAKIHVLWELGERWERPELFSRWYFTVLCIVLFLFSGSCCQASDDVACTVRLVCWFLWIGKWQRSTWGIYVNHPPEALCPLGRVAGWRGTSKCMPLLLCLLVLNVCVGMHLKLPVRHKKLQLNMQVVSQGHIYHEQLMSQSSTTPEERVCLIW